MHSFHDVTRDAFREYCNELQSHLVDSYVSGFIPYETGYILHEPLHHLLPPGKHEAILGIYTSPYIFDHTEGTFIAGDPPGTESRTAEYEISDLSIRTPRDRYIRSVECIKNHIAEGNTYQVNYTTHLDFLFSGSPLDLYGTLRLAQPTSFSALMRYGEKWILSLSPELYFSVNGSAITTRPMKGTMPRGRTLREDSERMQRLQNDPKNRAENLMIVDLLRNDIGRIAETGSVAVTDLFTVEKYRSVLQMTSSVSGTLRRHVKVFDLFDSLFPSGSVTGAPKLSTMRIIRELEESPRGVYTGAIGMIKPGGDAIFNVPIRTIEIEHNRGSMGIGSGIVWDSDPEGEYDECLLKAEFLTTPYTPIELIESMRYESGYHRLDMHLNRLLDSAQYFDIPIHAENIKTRLYDYGKTLDNQSVYKIRLTVDNEGAVSIRHEIIPAVIRQPVRLKLCGIPTDSADRFLYHKTACRELYRSEYEQALREGYFDVVFRNERDEITEGSITNIYIKENGMLYTPPVESGLLNGVYRQTLLNEGKANEKIIGVREFINAKEIYVSNSVRGLLRGTISYF